MDRQRKIEERPRKIHCRDWETDRQINRDENKKQRSSIRKTDGVETRRIKTENVIMVYVTFVTHDRQRHCLGKGSS